MASVASMLAEGFTLAERGEVGPAAFGLEEGAFHTVFFHEEEDDGADESSASTGTSTPEEELAMLARLHAALGGATATTTLVGEGGSSSSTGSGSVPGGAAADGTEWKVTLMEGMEDLLHLDCPGGRRFSFDLSGIDVHALEQLTGHAAAGVAALPGGSGPSSRRGSFSLSFLEAEAFLPKLHPAPPPAVKKEVSATSSTSSSGGSSAAGDDPTAAPGALTSDSSVTSSGSTSSSAGSSSASSGGNSNKRKKPDSVSTTSPGSPALSAAAAMLPTPQTPHKSGATAATTTAAAAAAAAAALSASSEARVSYALPAIPDDGQKRIGIYTVEERKARVARFQAKRHRRVWRKSVKYACRKNLADNRPRVKGRFVKREEEIDIIVGNLSGSIDQLSGLDELLAE